MQRDTKSHPAENQAEDEGERETRQESEERRLGVDDRDGDSDLEDENYLFRHWIMHNACDHWTSTTFSSSKSESLS
jgi:hypothetical protein